MKASRGHLASWVCLLGLFCLVLSLPARAETDDDNPFDQGAKDAAKRDPFFKKPAPSPPARPDEDPKRPDAAAPTGRADPEPKPKPGPVKLSLREKERVEKIVSHYIEMYGKHLRSPEWVTRAMAVISLAKIDDARITDVLLSAAEKDRDAHVSAYAWEALHARTPSLTAAQRARWLAAGCKLVQRDALRGALRTGFIRAIGSAEPTRDHQRAFLRLFAGANLSAREDQEVLSAMRETVVAWKSPDLIRRLVTEMGNINTAHRAERVLSGLGATVPSGRTLEYQTTAKESTVKGQKWVTHTRLGSKAAWSKVRRAWADWLRRTKPGGPGGDDLVPYAGRSALIAPAEKITDPTSRKWTKDLELPRFSLKAFDVNFVLDSTESMRMTMAWIKTDVARMMRALRLISRRPRMGVTLYRDYASGMRREDYLVTVSSTPSRYGSGRGNYVVKLAPMMSDADRLAKAVQGASAYGGGDTPEAVYEAIWAAVNKNTWSRSGAKLIVLVGDAPPHAKTMDKIKALVRESAGKGFRFLCVKVSNAYRQVPVRQKYNDVTCDLEASFDLIAEWGNGKAVALSPDTPYSPRTPVMYDRTGRRSSVRDRTSSRPAGHYRIIGEVLKSQLAEYYHDRVDPFVRVLLELVVVSSPETRTIVAPHSSSRKVVTVVRKPQPPPRPDPRPQPKRPKIERVYYVIDKKVLAYVYYDVDNKRALSAAICIDRQGRYTWRRLPSSEAGRISSRGKKITDERAHEIMRALVAGKDPFTP